MGLVLSTSLRAETVRITNGEWPPLTSQTLPHSGILSKIITDAFASQGVRVEYGFFPWKRSYVLARAGVWDGTAGWSRKAEREKYFYYSDPIYFTQKNFFYLKELGEIQWSKLSELNPYRIGATLEFNYGPEFDSAVEQKAIRVSWRPSDEANMKRLHDGKIDLFPQELCVGYYQIQLLFPNDSHRFTHTRQTLLKNAYHLLLSKKIPQNATRIKMFNQGLKEVFADGGAAKYLAPCYQSNQQHLQQKQ
ncbi:substrate-binding periplasmic protein [Dongshaea marina]|uniref:substrate-binding periplasmic protein n=1 Tax=Dongshaea marina TaxID=2047966 RepID=UPI00131EFC4C|nr:transporter substrate-binding domain-containing protein [Dongshaea marina]